MHKISSNGSLFSVSDIVNMNSVSVHAFSNGRVIKVSRRMSFTIREVNEAWVKSKR